MELRGKNNDQLIKIEELQCQIVKLNAEVTSLKTKGKADEPTRVEPVSTTDQSTQTAEDIAHEGASSSPKKAVKLSRGVPIQHYVKHEELQAKNKRLADELKEAKAEMLRYKADNDKLKAELAAEVARINASNGEAAFKAKPMPSFDLVVLPTVAKAAITETKPFSVYDRPTMATLRRNEENRQSFKTKKPLSRK